MRQVTWACRLAVVALASCSAVAPPVDPAVPAALLPYADAARFLLPGHSSVSFHRADDGPWLHEPAGGSTRPVLVARCGSSFEAPKGVGVGRFRGVQVADVGPGGTHSASELEEKGFRAVAIDGNGAWHIREEAYDGHVFEIWLAQIDDRFVVWAHDRADLERALARTGDLAELLRPFAAVHELPADVDALVCVLPRPGDRPWLASSPMPVEATVVCMPTASRPVFFHRQPLPAEFVDCVAAWSSTSASAPTTTSRGAFQVTEVAVDVNPSSLALALDILFGLKIFI